MAIGSAEAKKIVEELQRERMTPVLPVPQELHDVVHGVASQAFSAQRIGTSTSMTSDLLAESLAAIGVLTAMLQERIAPDSASCRELAQLVRTAGRLLGADESTVSRVAVAAHLYALDCVLRQEVGSATRDDIVDVFGAKHAGMGGLSSTLRVLGAAVLGEQHDHSVDPLHLLQAVIVAVAEREDRPVDPELLTGIPERVVEVVSNVVNAQHRM